MKKALLSCLLSCTSIIASAQQIEFEEYDLHNGLHVILHQDNSTPISSLPYCIMLGQKMKPKIELVSHIFLNTSFLRVRKISNAVSVQSLLPQMGGENNAYTTDDFTYYYEVFPSNNLELALWM
jgi:zinc protease